MSLEAHQDLVRRFDAEVINGQDLDAIDRLLTADVSSTTASRAGGRGSGRPWGSS